MKKIFVLLRLILATSCAGLWARVDIDRAQHVELSAATKLTAVPYDVMMQRIKKWAHEHPHDLSIGQKHAIHMQWPDHLQTSAHYVFFVYSDNAESVLFVYYRKNGRLLCVNPYMGKIDHLMYWQDTAKSQPFGLASHVIVVYSDDQQPQNQVGAWLTLSKNGESSLDSPLTFQGVFPISGVVHSEGWVFTYGLQSLRWDARYKKASKEAPYSTALHLHGCVHAKYTHSHHHAGYAALRKMGFNDTKEAFIFTISANHTHIDASQGVRDILSFSQQGVLMTEVS